MCAPPGGQSSPIPASLEYISKGMESLRVLFIEDSPEDCEMLALELEMAGYGLLRRLRVSTAAELRSALVTEAWDLILGDWYLPALDGMEALAQVRELDLDTPFLMISGMAGEDVAVAAMKAGANDFLVKGKLKRLGPTVARELRERRSREEKRRAEAALRESEEQLRQAQRMESVGRLAGGIAHDFNNILSVISGYANLLQMKQARLGMAHRELAEIEKAVSRASTLVKQLLTFSRRQVVRRQTLDLGVVLGEIRPILSRMLGEDVVLESRIEEGLPCVHADRGQIEQVIFNLAVNARDAMPKGGPLQIEIGACTLDPAHFREDEKAAPGPHVRLSMKDSGLGMDADTLSRIFEPFFTTKGEARGSGLGLSTVYGIVRQSGGTIRVQSIPFAGSVFTVYLPAVSADHAESREEARTSPVRRPANGESLLLVEDDQDLRRLVKDLLVTEGYRVLEARDTEEALGFAHSAELEIDLLISDLVMPGQHGGDLAESLLSLRPGLKVVFMSGYTADARALRDGWPESSYLDKPFTAERLLEKVRGALDAPRAEKQL